jgi:hypothetical protein
VAPIAIAERKYRLVAPAFLLAFLAVRIAGWLNVPRFEDDDSVGYLAAVPVYGSFDPGRVAALYSSPSSSPLHPLTAGIVADLGVPIEFAARFVSLFASPFTAMAVVLLAARSQASRGNAALNSANLLFANSDASARPGAPAIGSP